MALIVEGTTSKDITVAKPKATTTTTKATATTPAKTTTTVKTAAPAPVATVSKSTGGVKSTTMTPTAATKAATPTITATKPSTFAIQQGVKENFQQKVSAPAPAASTLGIAKTAQTNVVSPTATGVAGGISNIPGQQVKPVNQGQSVATPATTVSGVMGGLSAIEGQQVAPAQTPTEQPVTTFFDPYEASRQAQEALQAKAKADEEAAKRLQLQQNVDRINAPSPTTSMAVDTSSGLSNIGGAPNALGMPSDFGMMTGNPYFDQLMSMKFDYDPAKDPEYINGSKVLENQVAQMMVGRGGLYSSVNQAALSSKLIEFQIALRKQKYEQYIQDRSFMLQMANTIWDRQDAAFNQNMAIAKYNADREDAMFSRQMQQEQLNLQRASAALAQARYKAEVESYESANQLNSLVSKVKYEQGMYSKMYDEWRKTGVASTNVAAYFGTTPGAKFNYSAQKYTVAKVNYIDSLISQATSLARDMNELDIMQAGLAGFLEQEVVPTTEYKYTKTVGEEGTTLRTEWSEYK